MPRSSFLYVSLLFAIYACCLFIIYSSTVGVEHQQFRQCTMTIKRSILFRKAEVIGWLFTKSPFPFLCLYFSSFPQLFSSCLSLFHQGCEWQRKELRQQVVNRNETSSPLSYFKGMSIKFDMWQNYRKIVHYRPPTAVCYALRCRAAHEVFSYLI